VKCECTQGWNGIGWDGRVVSLSPIKNFNETKIISKNENKQKNQCKKYSMLSISKMEVNT
jgi:hypothetical protein